MLDCWDGNHLCGVYVGHLCESHMWCVPMPVQWFTYSHVLYTCFVTAWNTAPLLTPLLWPPPTFADTWPSSQWRHSLGYGFSLEEDQITGLLRGLFHQGLTFTHLQIEFSGSESKSLRFRCSARQFELFAAFAPLIPVLESCRFFNRVLQFPYYHFNWVFSLIFSLISVQAVGLFNWSFR